MGRGKDRDTRTSGGRHATYPSEDQRCAPATLTQLQFGRSIPDNEHRPTDWRFDFVPFKARPLIEVQTDKFLCTDIGFLIEKMHSGVYWAIFDGLSEAERPRLFKAWGILFEEYVNWFLTDRALTTPLLFYSAPKWRDGRECFDGAFVQDSRFMPMEYKVVSSRLKPAIQGTQTPSNLTLISKSRRVANSSPVTLLFGGTQIGVDFAFHSARIDCQVSWHVLLGIE